MTGNLGSLKATAAALALSVGTAQAADVEVLHWWTSGGEAAALNVLKQDLESQGIGWLDMPVAGGGGEQAMTVLRARVTAGDAPTAVQALGFDILDWANQGALANLNATARKGRLGRRRAGRAEGICESGWQVGFGSGERSFDELGVGEQSGA